MFHYGFTLDSRYSVRTRMIKPLNVGHLTAAMLIAPSVAAHEHEVENRLNTHDSDHADRLGISIDGYLPQARFNSDGSGPSDLDACRGHTTDGLGYHYHANDPGANDSLSGDNTQCDATIVTDHRPPSND